MPRKASEPRVPIWVAFSDHSVASAGATVPSTMRSWLSNTTSSQATRMGTKAARPVTAGAAEERRKSPAMRTPWRLAPGPAAVPGCGMADGSCSPRSRDGAGFGWTSASVRLDAFEIARHLTPDGVVTGCVAVAGDRGAGLVDGRPAHACAHHYRQLALPVDLGRSLRCSTMYGPPLAPAGVQQIDPGDVRRELQPGADLLELCGAFERRHPDAASRGQAELYGSRGLR